MSLKLKITGFVLVAMIHCSNLALAQEQTNYEALTVKYEKDLSGSFFKFWTKKQLSILYHNWAHELTQQGKWETAIIKQSRAYELQPKEPIIKKALAYCYNGYALELKEKKYWPEAIRNLKLALVYAPGQEQIKKNLAVVYLEMADEELKQAEYMRCENYLKEAESLDEDNAYVYVLKGELAYTRDDYYLAQEDYQKALKLNPQLYGIRIKLEKMSNEKKIEKNFRVQEIENFRLKFEGLDNQKLADKAAAILRDAYRQIGQDFNCFPQQVVPVIIYPQKALEKLDYFPDWAAGTYDGKIRIGEDLEKKGKIMSSVLFHEYTHVIVRILGGNNVPLWLNEGLAECQAHKFRTLEMKKSRKILLKNALKTNTLFSLDLLASMDIRELSALSGMRLELVYAQSESFVDYLIRKSSYYDMRNLLGRLSEGENIYKAVKEVLFVDLEVLVRNWKRDILE